MPRHYKEEAKEAVETVLAKATELAEQAQGLASQAQDFVTPYVEGAIDRVAPVVAEAKEFVKPAVNKAVEASNKAVEARKERAAELQEIIAEGPVALKELVESKKTKKRGKKKLVFVLTTLTLAAAGGIGYLLWRRSQPVEDPWSKEYWEELNQDGVNGDGEVEIVSEKAEEAK